MGINIGICELEAQRASCRELKTDIHRVKLDDVSGFEDIVEFDETVSLDKAKEMFQDWDAFMKRNRLNKECELIYLDKIKDDDNLNTLKTVCQRVCTGWVSLKDMTDERKKAAISASKPENRITGWDLIEFDQMNLICSECPLSWDKGRGCIGAFGPDNSLLPEIASRHNCKIVASAPQSAKEHVIYSPKDAEDLLAETEKLTGILPEEGKMMVRRYSGPLERMAAVARVSIDEDCGFYFF